MTGRIQVGLAGGMVFLAVLATLGPPQIEADTAPAGHKAYKEKIPGTDVTFEMVPIPGGTFLMGSPATEKGRKEDEGPQHPVTIRPFWMGKCEVTWDEFDIYRREKGVKNPEMNDNILKENPDAITGPTPPYVDETYNHGREGKPAICMTHHCAMVYCRWLSEKTGKQYRLPTEAEWEYAARAGSKTAYCFGDDPKQLADYAWFADNSEEDTHTVATRKPNAWGLHDMYGNVLEWCLDHYKKDYYASFSPTMPALCPVLLPTETRFTHVARGGSWADSAAGCRSAARRGSNKGWIKSDPQRPQSIWWLTNTDFIGFRIVRAVEEQDNLKSLRSKVTRQSKNQ
jgi:formylglycine-generating enzyme required for sulfatase activity